MEEVNKAMETFNSNSTTAAKPMRNRRSQQELKETPKPTQAAAEIHIKGLPKWVRARELLEVFADYGAILNVGIKATEGDKSSACISYEEPACAEEAVRALRTEIFFKMSRPLSMKLQYYNASDSLPRSSSGSSIVARAAAGDASQSRKPSDPATPLDYKTLHIALIPASVDKSDLEETFAPYGDIKRAQIVARTNKRSFAFVSFKTEQAAEAALQDMKTRRFFGMHELLRVDYAHLAVSKRGGGGGAAAVATEPAAAERRASTRRERRAARASSTKESGGGPASAEPASSVELADESDSDGSRTDEGKLDEEETAAAAAESGPVGQLDVVALPVACEVKDAPSKADENSVTSSGADTASVTADENSTPLGGAKTAKVVEGANGSDAVPPPTLDVTHAVAPRDVDAGSPASDSAFLASPVAAQPAISAEPSSPAVEEGPNPVEATKPENYLPQVSNENAASKPISDSPPECSNAAPDAAPASVASHFELKSDASAFVTSQNQSMSDPFSTVARQPEAKFDASSPIANQPEAKSDVFSLVVDYSETKPDASSPIVSQHEPNPDASSFVPEATAAASPTADQMQVAVVAPEPPAVPLKNEFESSLPMDKDVELTYPLVLDLNDAPSPYEFVSDASEDRPMTQELN
ncbi:hypothetical protein HDU87_007048 [Geranomyces variabilis]|uniref:RRM domain-containing protein n=1 Tax=Geranomyces variabilis TaxID=109894 RepID=A0AAD5XQ38_9FUNG|nr:hypothetical protein HDU87_007048 [Geranomyces variabilis]